MKEEKEKQQFEIYIRDNGQGKPQVYSVEVADSGCYWIVKIPIGRDSFPTIAINEIN